MRHGLRTAAILVVLGAIPALTGCQGWFKPVEPVQYVQNFQPSDLPVPLNFQYSEDESWAQIRFAEAPLHVRMGRFVYYGNRPMREVANWFLEQMPVEGWTHANTSEKGDIRVFFEKRDEQAEIHLERVVDDQGEFYITRVVAHIRPN